MKGKTYDIYYDEDGDFLEVTFGDVPTNEASEQIEDGVIVTKNVESGEVYGIGVVGFKKRCEVLGRVMKRFGIDFPLSVC